MTKQGVRKPILMIGLSKAVSKALKKELASDNLSFTEVRSGSEVDLGKTKQNPVMVLLSPESADSFSFALIRQLRDDPAVRHVPVNMLATKVSVANTELAMKLGAVYVPLVPDNAVDKIAAAMKKELAKVKLK